MGRVADTAGDRPLGRSASIRPSPVRQRRIGRVALGWGPPIAAAVLRWLRRTLRARHHGREHPEASFAKGESIIVAFWHGQLLMMPWAYPGTPAAILISQHRDGEYISRIAERLGFVSIRGSATRGGARAFRQLIQATRDGLHLVITPDGPKGPRGKVKSGVIELARLTGSAICPVAFSAWPRRFLRSWDRFLVPLPFARASYVWGEPLRVPMDAGKDEVRKLCQLLGERLDALTARAHSLVFRRGE